MSNLKKLAGETVIYGFSTILGRLLTWLMLPFYLRGMSESDNGLLTYLYSYIAILQVVMSFGFETGFFRFAKNHSINKLFSTLFVFVSSFCLFFLVAVVAFKHEIASLLDVENVSLIVIVALILVVDALGNLPFALLRFDNKSVKYALNRLAQVLIIVGLNLFFLFVLPSNKHLFGWLYYLGVSMDSVLYNVFYANFVGSLFVVVFLGKSIVTRLQSIDLTLLKTVFNYSFPVLVVGFFGMINYNIDKILLPKLLVGENTFSDLGIYGSNYKIGVLMAIFTQSFRMSFEPFFFKNHDKSNLKVYSTIMNYYVAFGMLIFLFVLLFLDLVNVILPLSYRSGNAIIPFVLISQLFFGIYYNLSLWYKLTDKTYFGIIFSVVGTFVSIAANIILVPMIGYIGAAISTIICNLVITVLSYLYGQKYMFIPYSLVKILILIGSGLIIYLVFLVTKFENFFLQLVYSSLLVLLYIGFIWFYLKPNFFWRSTNSKISI